MWCKFMPLFDSSVLYASFTYDRKRANFNADAGVRAWHPDGGSGEGRRVGGEERGR